VSPDIEGMRPRDVWEHLEEVHESIDARRDAEELVRRFPALESVVGLGELCLVLEQARIQRRRLQRAVTELPEVMED